MPKRNELIDVFASIMTGDENKCWPWLGGLGGRDRDRPYFSFDGKKVLAYRVVYQLAKGPIPDGELIRHTCDNSLCCNPKHLELGSHADNNNDIYMRDRAGLPVSMVREINRLLETTQLTHEAIAQEMHLRYGRKIDRSTVSKIWAGVRRAQEGAMTSEEVNEQRKKEQDHED